MGYNILDAYGPGDLKYRIMQEGVVLAEVDDMSFSVSTSRQPTGSGLGQLKNTRHKNTAAPTGEWSLSRSMLSAAENGEMFLKILMGSAGVVYEQVADASDTHTCGEVPVEVLEVRLLTSNVVLEPNRDYYVNYSTGVITFEATTSEAARVAYITEQRDWYGQNLAIGGKMDMNITGVWVGEATGVAERDGDNAYLGDYGLLVDVSAQNDGVRYSIPIKVQTGRTYRIRFRAKGTADDTIEVEVEEAGTDNAATAETGSDELNAEWTMHEFYYTATEAEFESIVITNSTAAPGDFYIDMFMVSEYQPAYNVMDAGNNQVRSFDVWAYTVWDGTVVAKILNCAVYDDDYSSGDKYSESVSGQFLDWLLQGEGLDDVSA
jgi:hypothetical protein